MPIKVWLVNLFIQCNICNICFLTCTIVERQDKLMQWIGIWGCWVTVCKVSSQAHKIRQPHLLGLNCNTMGRPIFISGNLSCWPAVANLVYLESFWQACLSQTTSACKGMIYLLFSSQGIVPHFCCGHFLQRKPNVVTFLFYIYPTTGQ